MPGTGFHRSLFAPLVLLAFLSVSVSCSGREGGAAPGQNRDAAPVGDSAALRDASQGIFEVSDEADPSDHPTDSRSDSTLADVGEAEALADGSELALCLRLMDPQNKTRELDLSKAVDDQYILLIQADCRVHKANYPPKGALAFAAWRNALYAYNLDLWGCTGKAPMGFALLSTEFQDVSAADAAQLIELYLNAATGILALTAREVANLRRDLQRLANPLITNESTDYTLSACSQDAGPEAGDAAEETKDALEEKAVDASEEMAMDASEEKAMDASEETIDAFQGDEEGGD